MEPEVKELMAAVEECRDHGGCTMGSACDCDATDKRLLAAVEREAAAFADRVLSPCEHAGMRGLCHSCVGDRRNRWRKVQEAK